MYTRRWSWIALLAGAVLAAQEPASLQVTGAVQHPLALTVKDLAAMPRVTARTTANGVETVWEGVLLQEILKKAGAAQSTEMRSPALTSFVLAHARDGYQALFSLVELDPAFTDSGVLVADTANGKPIGAEQGPFQLIAPKDKRRSRSVRMLGNIEVVQAKK